MLNKRITDLLADTGITPKSHPVLVSLLMLAGQGTKGGTKMGPGVNMKLHRDWKRVVQAFRRALAGGITDAKLRAAMPFPGLMFTDAEGWTITAPIPLTYRELVAYALETTANASDGVLKPQDIHDIDTLRDAQRRNRLPCLEADIRAPGKLEGRMLPGRRVIVSRELFGKRVHSLLESDEFGRLSALTHERSALLCRKFHDEDWKKRGVAIVDAWANAMSAPDPNAIPGRPFKVTFDPSKMTEQQKRDLLPTIKKP